MLPDRACGLHDQLDLVEQEIQGLLSEFWHATNSDDLRMESCIDREAGNFKVQLGIFPPADFTGLPFELV